jgi:hypothetical protein
MNDPHTQIRHHKAGRTAILKVPIPSVIDAAVAILTAPPDNNDVTVSVHPATVYRIDGHLVAVYHQGTPSGPVAIAECSCPGDDLCEHLLVALAGTEECP